MKAFIAAIAVLLLTVVVLAPVVLAQASGHFDLSWHVIAGGGGRSTSGGFAVNGSIGQPAVGPISSANHALGAGFWYGAVEAAPTPPPTPGPYTLYLPIVVKNFP